MLEVKFRGEWLPILENWVYEKFVEENINGEFLFYGIEDVLGRKVNWNTISGFEAPGFETINVLENENAFGFSIVLRMGEIGLASMEYLLDCIVKKIKSEN